MILNFNHVNLSQHQGSLPAVTTNPSGSVLTLSYPKVRTWWLGLPTEQKQKVCQLDAPNIMSDLANAANSALVVCKLNHTYKKKELISWTKQKDDNQGLVSQTFEFSLKGKQVVDDSLAELYSSFYIFLCKNPRETSDRSQCKPQAKSHIGIKSEDLNSILDFLTHSRTNFAEGEKLLYQRKDFSDLYSFLIEHPPQQIAPLTNLHPHLRILFERLYAFSFLLEWQIYLAYFDDISSRSNRFTPKGQESAASPAVLDKLNNLSSLVKGNNTRPTNQLSIKTVTQLEKESQTQEAIGDQNSTASGSPRNPITPNPNQQINLEELSQKLLQKTVKRQVPNPVGPEASNLYPYAPIAEELTRPSSRVSPPPQLCNEGTDQVAFLYEGFQIGNLQITFDPTDVLLTRYEEDDEVYEQDQSEFERIPTEEAEDILGTEDKEDFEEKDEEGKVGYHLDSDGSLTNRSNSDSFYMPSNPGMNYMPGYSHQSYYNSSECYPPTYYNQQPNPMIQYSYGVPIMYMPPANVPGPILSNPGYSQQMSYPVEPTGYHHGYNVVQPNKKGFEFQPSYRSERDNYTTSQGFGEYPKYDNHQAAAGNTENGKTHFFGRDKSRYENTKPKLPPRFQRLKENMYRN